jgi:hypothetical protein
MRELTRHYRRFGNMGAYHWDAGHGGSGLRSAIYDPLLVVTNQYGALKTADRYLNRTINCDTLRRVASKAWIISICKLHIIRHIEPFLKPSTDRNKRGFVILQKGEDISKASGQKSKERESMENFLMKTGFADDPYREDGFTKYCTKIVNDMLDLDQIATEIQYTRINKPFAFWAVDAATIEKVLPGQHNPENIRYAQVIDHIPYAFYTKDEMVFDFQYARTDVRYSFYGYSYVEQAIDLITGFINAFVYNSGYFTENKLPRGMLLIDGYASQETIELMEDYLYDIMSGSPSSQWRIPIVPSSSQRGESGAQIKFVPMNGTNKEMEYQNWLDLLISAVCALFGVSIDEIGLHTQKSQPLFNTDNRPIIEESRSRVLSNILGHIQSYLNRIIEKANPDYRMEFVGYERENPKEVLDLDRGEVESYKTLNEKREEKGFGKLDAEWADIPLNPQAVQLFQAARQGAMPGGMPGLQDMEEGEDGESAWGEAGPDGAGAGGEEAAPDNGGGDFGKSLRKEGIRIVI